MSPLINILFILSSAFFFVVIMFDFVKSKNVRKFSVELFSMLLLFLILNQTSEFPNSSQSFGGKGNPVVIVTLLLIFVVLGMVANYFFHLKKSFDWLSFIKPFFISPIVLLPLVGTVNFDEIEMIQLISLTFLAFQNGFFWKEIYNKAQKIQV